MGKKGRAMNRSWLNITLILWVCAASAGETQSPDTIISGITAQAEISIDPPPSVLIERIGDGELTLCWPLVQGATGYRTFRGIVIEFDADSLGHLVKRDEPRLAWIPWTKVDLTSDTVKVSLSIDYAAQVGSATVDSSGIRLSSLPAPNGSAPYIWGVSTVMMVGGVAYNSKIRRADTKIKATLLCWWDFDVNEDGRTDYGDFFLLMDSFGAEELDYLWNSACDFSGDRKIDMDDVFIFADWWDLLRRLPHDRDQCGNPEIELFRL